MADKCIGNLTLNINGVKTAVAEVNKMLADIGVGKKVNISSKVTAAVKDALKEVTAMLQNSEKQIAETANKAVEAINKIGQTKVNNAAQKSALAEATAQLKEYYDLMKKAEQARASGNTANQSMYSEAASQRLERINDLLRFQAQQQETVNKKVMEYNAARNSADKKMADQASKSAADEAKKTAAEVEKAAQAYIKLEEARAKANIAKQNYGKESVEYAKAHAEVLKLQQAWNSYSDDVKKAAQSTDTVNEALTRVVKSENELLQANQRKATEVDLVRQIQNAYNELTDAIKNYNLAKEKGDNDGMAAAQTRIDAAMQEVRAINEAANASKIAAGAKQKVVDYTRRATTAERQHKDEIDGSVNKTGELESQLQGIVTRYLSLVAVIRTINNLIRNMVEYVSEYSQKMNEIQMITLKSNEDVAQLSDTYREIAKEMSVSSLDLADAAIYFTRQGLGAEEIEERLEHVTRYAKAANVEFKEASEIITAVVNSMGLVKEEAEDGRNATQRVADVFLMIGDNAATSGQEIGSAMQKAAASAGTFGVSMEWLASYIAAVSETTRQEARTIGTAFNTIIARLHQIRTTGFNQEDETKINDISKALNSVGIALMDQEHNWRDMEVILEELAGVWGTLNDKQKSYIATTMAGVKQQNVFLALMNDMSKGVEGGSRAYELHEKAVNSDGIAEQKYAVYLDSVTAAQNRLTIAQESFYALLDQNVIKGWYDALAGIVNKITEVTSAMGGLNIIVPIVAGGITLLVLGITKLSVAITAAGSASAWFGTVWTAHPVLLTITAVVAAITALTGVVGIFTRSIDPLTEAFDKANEKLEESQEKITDLYNLQDKASDMFKSFGDRTKLTAKDLNEYNGLLESLSSISPVAKHVVDQLKDGFITQQEAAEKLNAELEKLINNEKEVSMHNLVQRYGSYRSESVKPQTIANLIDLFNQYNFTDDKEMAFEMALQSAYLDKNFGGKSLDEDTFKYIEGLLESYKKAGFDENERWKMVSGDILYELFGSFSIPDDMTQALVDEINKEIDYTMSVVANSLDIDTNSLEMVNLRTSLYNAIFGDDGEISPKEYSKFANTISVWLLDLYQNGVESVLNLSAKDKFSTFIKDLFGMTLDDAFGMVNFDINEYINQPGFVDAINNAYSELLSLGFSKIEIRDLFESIPVEKWGEGLAHMKARILSEISKTTGSALHDELEDGSIDMLMWDDLDLSTLKLIRDMVDAGTAINDIKDIMRDSESVDDFKAALDGLAADNGIEIEDEEDEVETFTEKVKRLASEIENLTGIIDALKGGDTVDFDDLLDLASAHPEIMAVISDTEALIAELEKLRSMKAGESIDALRNAMLNSEELYNEYAKTHGGKYKNATTLGEEAELSGISSDIDQFINMTIAQFLASTGQLENAGKEIIGELMTSLFSDSNVDLLNRKAVQVGESFATVLTETITASKYGREGIKWDQDVVVNFTPITPDGKLLDDETFHKYIDELFAKSKDLKELFENDKIENGGKGLLIGGEEVFGGKFDEAIKNAESLAEVLHILQEAYYGATEAQATWLEQQFKQAEINKENEWAKSNGYVQQIEELQNALNGDNGVQRAMEIWNSYDESMQKSIADTYPSILEAMYELEQAMKDTENQEEKTKKATDNANSAFNKTKKYLNTKYFKDTADAMIKLEKGTINANDAYEVFNKELNNVKSAYEDIQTAQDKMADGSEIVESDVKNLASALGLTAQEVIDDFPGALEMFEELRQAGIDAYNELNKQATMRILGIGEADFSQLMSGMVAVQDTASSTVQMLLALGQFELEERDVEEGITIPVVNADGSLSTITTTTAGHYQFLVPKGNNPLGKYGSSGGGGGSGGSNKSGGGGGGGGGGGNENKGPTEVEKMLDIMNQINDIQESQKNFYQAQQKYYSQTGQLQGVIGYMQMERDVLKEQNGTLEENIRRIEEWMEKKRSELASLSTTDEAYEEVSGDLDKLQKAHQDYTKQLIENKTAIEALTESIDEQRKKIRQMEINLRETILKAIQDREKKTEDMLNAEVQMENTILGLIKKRYEKERDQIIETTNLKIDSLNKEKELLDEQLRIRREQSEEEDKALKLRQLEEKYQRILADPTRKKEAQKIKSEIDELREEMAWDLAEKEVEAQKDSIDQQVESLEDYVEYVENYYEDLFEHPQKLIEEMRNVIQMAHEEVIEWLKENDEDYKNSSENTKEVTLANWEETYNTMKGIITTYWDEVEEIIEQGDDYIIEFLKENSADYAEAGKLQAEAYVEEWKKQLDDLKKAYEQVQTEIAATYDVIEQAEGDSGSGGGGGGGGSGGGPGGGGGNTETAKGSNALLSSIADLAAKIVGKPNAKDVIVDNLAKGPLSMENLHPYNNDVSNSLTDVLKGADKIGVFKMPNIGGVQTYGGNPISVGDIIVNVDNLDTDDDYKEMTEKVGKELIDKMRKTSVVGGLNVRSI